MDMATPMALRTLNGGEILTVGVERQKVQTLVSASYSARSDIKLSSYFISGTLRLSVHVSGLRYRYGYMPRVSHADAANDARSPKTFLRERTYALPNPEDEVPGAGARRVERDTGSEDIAGAKTGDRVEGRTGSEGSAGSVGSDGSDGATAVEDEDSEPGTAVDDDASDTSSAARGRLGVLIRESVGEILPGIVLPRFEGMEGQIRVSSSHSAGPHSRTC